MDYGIVSSFVESVTRFPLRQALVVNMRSYSYSDLRGLASRIGYAILKQELQPYPLVAILAHRSVTAYAAILGTLGTGKGYVPLNPKFPVERTVSMLNVSGCTTVIVGGECQHLLPDLLSAVNHPLTILLPDTPVTEAQVRLFPRHQFASCPADPLNRFPFKSTVKPTDIAYLLFTSGSTGQPNGVPISHGNVRSYLDYIHRAYEISETDRFSQMFDLTFDLSVHDMFVCWGHGACLFCLRESCVGAPAKFIRDNELTVWFSVPSVISMLSRMRLLRPNCFPRLRYSLFCGEPLPAAHASLWQEAAPNSILENLYGPTEATIAISRYRWNAAHSRSHSQNAITPIGWIFDHQRYRIVDSALNAAARSQIGELCLSGSQVSSGYWNQPEKTQERFVHLKEERESLWYRTGDLVKEDEDGCLHFCSRVDEQVKIRGYRVELQEIDAVLRRVCGSEQVASVPWPAYDGNPTGIVGFVSGAQPSEERRVLSCCRQVLPDYMVPSRIVFIREMPLNANGKLDRRQLTRLLSH
jgi:amino acid adenylation domain-containing protein